MKSVPKVSAALWVALAVMIAASPVMAEDRAVSDDDLTKKMAGKWQTARIVDKTEGEPDKDVNLAALGVGATWEFLPTGQLINHTNKQKGKWSIKGGRLIMKWEDERNEDWKIESLSNTKLVTFQKSKKSGKSRRSWVYYNRAKK